MPELRPRTRKTSSTEGFARHGQLKKGSPLPTIFKLIGAAVVVVLVSSGAVGGVFAYQIYNDFQEGSVDISTPGEAAPPAVGKIEGGFNVLIVGSDQCEEWDGCQSVGDRGSGKLNDVTMLLHVSEDQTNAVAVSFPRDLIVPIPSCEREDGAGTTAAMSAQQINVTLSDGGLPCTVKTVEELTGLDIQYAGLITFKGVIAMSNAVGGVKVCLTGDLNDTYSKINLTAGSHTLKGKEALAFLRSRHGIGDGSDVTRISSQQVFLSSLVRTLQSKDTLSDPTKVYNIAKAASKNMQLSTSLASLDTMYSMALALKDVPLEKITFVQYPGRLNVPGPYEQKVLPDVAKATQLFDLIKDDQPFQLATTGGGGSAVDEAATKAAEKAAKKAAKEAAKNATANPSASASASADSGDEEELPTYDGSGQTAADRTCSVTNN